MKYSIPFYYTTISRIKSKAQILEYVAFYFIIGLILLFTYTKVEITTLMLWFIGFVGMISIYEIGYLRNDFVTIKKEKSPKLRCSITERENIINSFKGIVLLKYLYTLMVVTILYLLEVDLKYFIICLVLIEATYLIHNNLRSKITYITFFLLTVLRYFTPFTLISNINLKSVLISVIFLIAIPRMYDKLNSKLKRKYKSTEPIKKIYRFRTVYYFVVFLFILILGLREYLIITLYLLIYRTIIYLRKK